MFCVSRIIFLSFVLCFLLNTAAQSMVHQTHDMSAHRMHEHHMGSNVPIGVMGGHSHHEGSWMMTYRYMRMLMDGNREGTGNIEVGGVHDDFLIAPTEMTMEMHMLGIMYAPTNRVTLMAMIPYVRKEMDHVTRMNADFTTRTEGIGDVMLTALYQLYSTDTEQLHFNISISLPAGSIDEKGHTPAGRDSRLPYPMQLGSGTFDFIPGITYLSGREDWSWGAQVTAQIRTGKNDNEYALGDQYEASIWYVKKWLPWLSMSLRAEGRKWDNIEGADPEITAVNPMGIKTVPTADTSLRAGERLDLLLGIDMQASQAGQKGARFALEGGIPVYQYLDGPQLETDWILTAGVQWTF